MSQPTTAGAANNVGSRILMVLALAVLSGGCANTGVTTRSVVEVQGAIEDARLYREAKRIGDKTMLDNLSVTLFKLGDVAARLELEKAAAGGALVGEVEQLAAGLAVMKEAASVEDVHALAQRLRDAARLARAIAKADAERVVRELHAELLDAHNKLRAIRETQLDNEIHYENLRTVIQAAVGLLTALAERERSEQELTSRGAALSAAAATVTRQAAGAAATGGAGLPAGIPAVVGGVR